MVLKSLFLLRRKKIFFIGKYLDSVELRQRTFILSLLGSILIL
jgi:hypothetical protein